jgi:hypothetical protein
LRRLYHACDLDEKRIVELLQVHGGTPWPSTSAWRPSASG